MEKSSQRPTIRPPNDTSDPSKTRPYDSGSVYYRQPRIDIYKDAAGQLRTRQRPGVWIGSISYVDGQGKRQRPLVTGTTKTEVQRKLRDLVKAKIREEVTTGSRHTLEWLMAQWLATKAHREANTRGTYERYTRLWVVPHLGRLTLKQLDSREAKGTAQAWVNNMRKTLGPKSVRHAHATLSGALNWGIGGIPEPQRKQRR